jgi:hypothetical protein
MAEPLCRPPLTDARASNDKDHSDAGCKPQKGGASRQDPWRGWRVRSAVAGVR